MAITPKIKFYPVKNGDSSLIKLSDETTILIDCNITDQSKDDKAEHRFDVLNDWLSNELKEDSNGNPFVDIFLLTHPDIDHCRGFSSVFFLDAPKNYPEKDEGSRLIRIDELWFTPEIFEEYHEDLNDEAKEFKEEAERRLKLHQNKDGTRNDKGNRLRIIGKSDHEKLEGLEHITSAPGTIIKKFNTTQRTDFSFFVHAPFKIDLKENENRNDTSTILQARFNIDGEDNSARAIFGGDAGWTIWSKVLEKTKDDENLKWDLFMAPHHCSWGYFNTSFKENPIPKQTSLDILDKKLKGARVVASSKKVENNDDNPPRYEAKIEYVNKVGKDNFYCIDEHLDSDNNPYPIEFEATKNGFRKKAIPSKSTQNSIGKVTESPKTYG
jgi:hypothetical protein